MQKDILKLLWHFTKPYARRRNLAIVMLIISVILETYITPFVLSQFMNMLQAGTLTMQSGLPLIFTYGGILLASTVVTWRITLWATWTFEVNAMRDLSAAILDHLAAHSLRFHSDRFGGSLISQATKLTHSLDRFWDTIIWDFLPIVSGIITATIILSFVYWPYALFLFVFSIVFGTSVFFGSRFLHIRSEQETAAWNKMTGFVADVITNISTVKAFGSEASENAQMNARTQEWQDKSFGVMRGFLGLSTVWSSLIVMIHVSALYFAMNASVNHTISIGSVYLMLVYTISMSRQLWHLNHVMRQYYNIIGDASQMVQYLNLPAEIADRTSHRIKAAKGAITFRDVSFAHDGGKGVNIFRHFNLTINPGERVGIVGHSGSGKTTFTRLLLRFNDIDGGMIEVDGQNIADVSQQSLRKSIAYVAQEPILFHRTLADNIAYGKSTATRGDVVRAAKQAHAWEFIQNLPDGLDTMVGERGIKLSGGQRQRIAIARAILKDAPILVLDEATSALDSASEKLIQASLDKLMKRRTSIVIAHRLSTIAKLDRIIVLENGEVVEDGSHRELLAHGGIYAKLWGHQSGGFIDE